jgi:nucleotide-binding universal stress UspA family protein
VVKKEVEMYETIIWAADGSPASEVALEEARRLAEDMGGRIVAVHCDQRLNGRAGGWPALADEDDARLRIVRVVEELEADGVPVELVMRRSHHEAADVVASIAAEAGADVIVCVTRGRTPLAGAFLGSFTVRLLHVAPCPVLAVPTRGADSATPVDTRAVRAGA